LRDGENDLLAQCATVVLPLDDASPESDTIEIGMKRLRAKEQPARGQLWLVDGGPGGAATTSFGDLMSLLAARHPDLDLMTADHRGTGRSDRLGCPDQEKQGLYTPEAVAACGDAIEQQWGNKLQFYSTTESARDLSRLISLTRAADQQVFLYGGSYGSYHVLRYLQLFPHEATGVMVDGIAPPGFAFDDFDERMSEVGQTLFERCGDDAFCNDKLGGDPWGALQALEAALDQGHCAQLGADGKVVKSLFGALLYWRPLSEYLPALTYRFQRCNAADRAAIISLYNWFSSANDEGPVPAFSDALFFHVSVSELWPDPAPPPSLIEERFAQALVATGAAVQVAHAALTWPRYDPAPYDDVWPDTDIPMLMTEGELDPATPAVKAAAMETRFTSAHQTYLTFPNTGHCVYGQTPTSTQVDDDCAWGLMDQFLTDPEAPLDASCIGDILPLTFQGNPQMNQALLGTPDAWENETTTQLSVALETRRRVERMMREVRRHLPRSRGHLAGPPGATWHPLRAGGGQCP